MEKYTEYAEKHSSLNQYVRPQLYQTFYEGACHINFRPLAVYDWKETFMQPTSRAASTTLADGWLRWTRVSHG